MIRPSSRYCGKAVGPVGQRYRVGGVAEIIFNNRPIEYALAELGDPVGGVHGCILETQEEGVSGGLDPGNKVGDVHLDCDGRAGVVHGKEVVEVVEPRIFGHIDLFA